MKELDGWVKIKKYTDDEGQPVCGDCILFSDSSECDILEASEFIPGPTCQIWRGESKSEWQPISTAPKDGTLVIVCETQADHKIPCVAQFTEHGWFSTNYMWMRPTHWMPLPAPPQEK